MLNAQIAVIIPTYKARDSIVSVINSIPSFVSGIYVVDDACPDKSGAFLEDSLIDSRVKVIYALENQGVGGATIMGLQSAFENGAEIAVKMDSDGQHISEYIQELIAPISLNTADYVKGSRFLNPAHTSNMPGKRLFLNAILSFTNKFASGYYSITDPTNGFFAISKTAFTSLRPEKIKKRYFFESDMLFHLGLARMRVKDIPMLVRYGNETSDLKVRNEALNFMFGNIGNFVKRIWSRHFVLNFSLPAIYLSASLTFISSALLFGLYHWTLSVRTGMIATPGTVMLVALLAIVGVNFLTSFFVFDVNDEPR